MKVNTAKAKMLQGQPAYGYAMGMGSPVVAESLASSGIDFLLLDTQHGSFGGDSTNMSILAMSHGTATPMARVSYNSYTLIGRLLDEGVLGVVVPLVHTREDAQMAADACRLPPVGKRSWGWGGANRHGADYPDRFNDEFFLAIQIESSQAVDNAEAIMSTPGVDGCWIGPADLALSLGVDPRHMHEDERHMRALERVVEACRNTGKIPGYAAFMPDAALKMAAMGFLYLTAGSDSGFMMDGARRGVQTLGLTRKGDADYM
jgi:4-hydroxy-2-oxoheptanedioate aldolase